jgi:formate/nitrite transporter
VNAYNTPAEITAIYAVGGAEKTKKPALILFLLGILAGCIIGLTGAGTNAAIYGIADPWTARTICAVLFPCGLCIIITLGAELFTGNCLITISLLEKRCTLGEMLRNWTLVYLGNFAGAALVAAGCAYFGQMNFSAGHLAAYTMKVAAAKCAISLPNALVMGILCNVLVGMAVLMAFAGRDAIGRVVGAFLPVIIFVLCGFEHCVANMYYITAGLMLKAVPAYAKLAGQLGYDLSALSWGNFLIKNLVPVTLGNIIGGGGLGALMWYCHRPKKDR